MSITPNRLLGFGGSTVLTCALCLFLGCDAETELPLPFEEEAMASGPEQSSDRQSDRSDDFAVIAVVNDRQITHHDVERRLDRLAELYHHSRRPFDESMRAEKREEVIERLIDRELLREHITRSNIEIDPRQVDERMQVHIESRFGSSSSFQRYLEAEELSIGDFRRQIHEEIAVEELIVDDEEFTVDEEQLRRHYDRIASRRPAGQRVHASTFSIRIAPEADDAIRERLRELLTRHLATVDGSQAFEELASEIGQGPNRAKVEELRWLERHQVHPNAARYLFDDDVVEEGLTPIIDTPLGFEVYWIYEHREAGIRQFDEVEDLLRQRALRSRLEERRRNLIFELRQDPQISIEIADDLIHPALR